MKTLSLRHVSAWSFNVFFLATMSPGRLGADDNGFPERSIANGVCKLTLLLPDAKQGYYRGTRFDWSGIIRRAEYNGHTFFGAWRDHHDPNNHDDVMG